MWMRSGETLQSYTSRYWELYNEIRGGNEQVAASTFQLLLPEESGLRDSLTMQPPEGMQQLMRRIEEYKRLEDDELHGKGKEPASSQYFKEYRPKKFQPKARRELRVLGEGPKQSTEGVNVAFKELVYKILECIKNET